MIANYHTHTQRCKHAYGEDREYIESAIKSGMKVLGFSDHCPWVYNDDFVSSTRMLSTQIDEYFTTMDSLKREYLSDIKIYVGFEAEYIPELMYQQNKLFKGYPIDYMILGQHFNAREPYAPYTGFPTDDEFEFIKYIDLSIEALETGRYSYMAHPDLFNFVGDIKIYNYHYERLCRYLKEKNIPVEINMLGLVQGRHYPNYKFFKIAQRIGNTAIIGCDAHSPSLLKDLDAQKYCKHFAERYDLKLVDTLPNLD